MRSTGFSAGLLSFRRGHRVRPVMSSGNPAQRWRRERIPRSRLNQNSSQGRAVIRTIRHLPLSSAGRQSIDPECLEPMWIPTMKATRLGQGTEDNLSGIFPALPGRLSLRLTPQSRFLRFRLHCHRCRDLGLLFLQSSWLANPRWHAKAVPPSGHQSVPSATCCTPQEHISTPP